MYTIDFSHPSSLYFVGIGGISMSGMALLLQDAGFQVCGSDRSPSAATGDYRILWTEGRKYDRGRAD